MHWARIISGAGLILVVVLSTYFGAVAAAPIPSAVGPSLILYQLSSQGQIVASTVNMFEAGQMIWVGVPSESSPPYTLTIMSLSGVSVWSQQNSSIPASRLIPVSLAPALFAPGLSYTIALQVMISYSPGFSAPQTSTTSFAVLPAFAGMLLKSYSFQNATIQAQIVLQDSNNNPLTGVRLGLFLLQGNSSLLITTEKTDMLGRSSFNMGESLSGGNYQFQVRVLDNNAVFAIPVQLPSMTVNSLPTVLRAWNTTSGRPEAVLVRGDNGAPVQGRLVVLEQKLKDGNWSVSAMSYTGVSGIASFTTPTPSGTWHVVFRGDGFYSPSASDGASISAASQPSNLASQVMTQSSMFSGNTFSNGHITLKIGSSTSTIYDSQGQKVLGHLSWGVQFEDSAGAWQALPWDGLFSLSMDDPAGYHRVTLTGTAGNGQVAVSMSFVAKPQDVLFTPLRMPVDVQALRGLYSYRMVWRLDGVSASFFQFEQRAGDQRTIVRGPVIAGVQTDQSPAGENSMVALAADRKTILFGLNWDSALRYYQGTSLGSGSSGTTALVQFGDVALSSGKHWIIPACPCPDGGGGGGSLLSTTTLYLPSSPYATLNTVLKAQVKDLSGIPVPSVSVNFYKDGTLLGSGITNATGYASLAWTPGVTGSHSINATFVGNCCYSASSTVQTLTINQTPTTIEMLQPQQIVFSWDLYNYYSGNGLPIVVPVNILTLAPSNNTSPANIYMPAYNGASSVPPHVSGYGWAGLNLTSAVTITMNGTYTQTQNMNWTRNFYLPPCPNPPNCSTVLRNGHLYLTASLSPPSTLYSASYTSLNIPYQDVNSISATNNQVVQTATPPANLYVNVNATYPYLSVTMQGLPVALAAYNAYLAYTLGGPTSSFLSSGYTFYALPGFSDFAYVCTDSTCNTPAANVAVYLYDLDKKGSLVYCGVYSNTNNRGLAYINGNGLFCGYPYAYAAIYTSGNTLTLSELFHTEAVSNPSPFLTNFQGYNYAVYAPQRTGRYLLDMRPFFLNSPSPYTILYPSTSYSDIQYPYLSCCDIFLTVRKHPLQAQASFNPATATILSNTNATIQLRDLATSKPLSYSSFSYTLTRSTPNPGTIRSGGIATDVNGTAVLSLGLLAYGNYTLSVSRSATTTLNGLSASFNITIYKALPTIILRDISSLASATQGIIRLINPAGTPSTPSIIHSQSSPYEFYEIIGGSADVSSAFIKVYYFSQCPSCTTGGYSGSVVIASWSGGQLSGPIACAQPAFANCSYSLTRLMGISNICGASYCYRFSVFAGSMNNLPLGWYLNVAVGACVNSSTNCANNCADTNCFSACGSGITIYCNWGYLDNPDGSFLVSGASVRHSDLNAPVGSAVRFQFNATSSPNSITSVTMNIFNQTSSTNTSICLIGGSGCLQPAQTTTSSFLLYSPSTIYFKPGNYVLTVTMTCTSCVQTTIQVLSLVLVVSQSSWSENGLALSQYIYETSLVNNATSTQLTVAGLTENIYINGVLYTTLQTDSNGNGAFTWTPSAAGQYMIRAVFPGQNFYTNSSSTIMVSVARRNVLLAPNNSPQSPSVNQPVTWNVYARDMASNSSIASLPISLFINGVNTTTVNTGSTGYAVFNPPAFPSKGSYNITFVSATTSIYNSATSYDPLMVYLDTKLTVQAGTITLGQNSTITVTLQDSNGNPLSARTVLVSVNGAPYRNVTTNNNGQGQFNWRPDNTGTYSISASFSATGSADFGYRASSGGFSVNVVPQTTVNTQTTSSVTQSVSVAIAGGSPQTPPPSAYPTITVAGDTVYIQFAGISGSLRQWNEFPWNCVARVFGACVLSAPFWNLHLDIHIQNLFIGIGYNVISFDSPSLAVSMPGLDQLYSSFISSPVFWTAVGFAGLLEGAFLVPLLASIAVPGIGEAASLAFLVGFPLAITVMDAVAQVTYQQKTDRQKFFAGVLASIVLIGGANSVQNIFSTLARTAGKVPGLRDVIFRGVMFAAMITAAFFLASS